MKLKKMISSSIIFSGIISSMAFSKPTIDFPDTVSLLKHEKGIHYKKAWKKTLWPMPFPLLINNLYSGSNGWKKYNKVERMYKLYKSAEIVMDTIEQDKDKSDKKYLKSYNRIHSFLLKLQAESRKFAASKNDIIERKEAQIFLDQKIASMITEDLASLLRQANRTIPQTCGKPEAAVANFDGYNLRFKIRTASLYMENLSMLEEEIKSELEKIVEDSNIPSEDSESQEQAEPAPEASDAEPAPSESKVD